MYLDFKHRNSARKSYGGGVLPNNILLYYIKRDDNSCCWAAPKAVLKKLDVVRRRYLTTILNYKYPGVISNANLYKRCKGEPLSARD